MNKNLKLTSAVLALVSFFMVSPARADQALESAWDTKATLDVSYPPAMVVNLWAGLYQKFRLARLYKLDKELAPFEHGYIRPHLRLTSSFKVNHIEPRFDLYPFSFLGITAGWTFSQRALGGMKLFEKFTGYDCNVVNCQGWNLLPFVEAKLKWGFGPVFGVFFVRHDGAELMSGGSELLSYDSSSGMVFRSSGDSLRQIWALAGTKVAEDCQVLARVKRLHWRESDVARNDVSILYTQKLSKDWAAGAEIIRSFRNDGHRSTTVALRVSWDWRKSPAAEDSIN